MKRIYFLFMLAILMSASVQAQKSARMFIEPSQNQAPFMYTSPNGKYGCGYAAGKAVFHLGDAYRSEYFGVELQSNYLLAGVNDKGEAVGSFVAGGEVASTLPYTYIDGKWGQLPLPEGYSYGGAMDISADGRTIVGWAQKGMYYDPCIWKDRKVSLLKYPSTDPYGELSVGAIAAKVDASGEIVLLKYLMHTGFDLLAICKDINKECEILCSDLSFDPNNPLTLRVPNPDDYITAKPGEEGYEAQVQAYNNALDAYYIERKKFETGYWLEPGTAVISQNGKYVGVTYSTPVNEHIAGRIDVETGELHKLEQLGSDVNTLSINDKGDLCLGMPFFSTYRDAYIYFREKDELVNVKEWIKEEYNFDIFDQANGIGKYTSEVRVSGSLVMSNDCQTFYGYFGGGSDLVYNLRISLYDPANITEISGETIEATYENGKLILNKEAEQVEIFNLAGTLVYQAKNITSACPELSQGIYVIKVQSGDKTSTSKIIVK